MAKQRQKHPYRNHYFAIITVSIISLCINNTTKSIIDDYKTRFGSEVTIAPDMSKTMS